MLYPQSNEKRSVLNLNGVWNYKFVSDDFVPSEKSFDVSPMAVPASMNDILTDRDKANYIGKVLYEREFSLPADEKVSYRLRIGSVSHKSEVYLNGVKIGEGFNGYLPVDLPLENLKGKNRLSVVIDNRLPNHTLPMGELVPADEIRLWKTTGGEAVIDASKYLSGEKQVIKFDFYNFTGIHRDVLVYSLPKNGIEDVVIQTVVGGDYEKIKATGAWTKA